jgi:CheY-like chemotaxis protein
MVPALDRLVPVILLIEDDETDRMRLVGMLQECGYGVMAASRAADALDVFVIHHAHIALVLSTARISEFARAQLLDALSRIDARVPTMVARLVRHASMGRAAFAEVIADVRHRLQGVPRSLPTSGVRHSVTHTAATPVDDAMFFGGVPAAPSSSRSHSAFTWPLRDEDVDEIEWADPVDGRTARDEQIDEGNHPEPMSGLEPVRRNNRLKPIECPDLRNYLAGLHKARQHRWERIALIAITVAVGSALGVATLLQLRTNVAQAFERDATVTAPLPSISISDRLGIVHLVPVAHLNQWSPPERSGRQRAEAARLQWGDVQGRAHP